MKRFAVLLASVSLFSGALGGVAVADEPEGACPSPFELRQEGLSYPVGAYDFEDRNDDGFTCHYVSPGGVRVVIDNAVAFEPEGTCPSPFHLLQEGVNYPVGGYEFEDHNDDGAVCRFINGGGIRIIIDNAAG